VVGVEDVSEGWDEFLRTEKLDGISNHNLRWFVRQVQVAGKVRMRQSSASEQASGSGRNQAKRKYVRT